MTSVDIRTVILFTGSTRCPGTDSYPLRPGGAVRDAGPEPAFPMFRRLPGPERRQGGSLATAALRSVGHRELSAAGDS